MFELGLSAGAVRRQSGGSNGNGISGKNGVKRSTGGATNAGHSVDGISADVLAQKAKELEEEIETYR